MNKLEKFERITQLLEDLSFVVTGAMDNNETDKDYKNLDEVISYLRTAQCVLPQRSLEYYLERIM